MEKRKGPVSIFFRFLKAISQQKDSSNEQGLSNTGEPRAIDDGSANEVKVSPNPPDLGNTRLHGLPASTTETQNFTSVGGESNDTLSYFDGKNVVYDYSRNNISYGDAGNDVLFGGGGDDTILYGDAGNDVLFGGGGDDTILYGDAGNNVWSGGGGDDINSFGYAGNDVSLGDDTSLAGDDISLAGDGAILQGKGLVHRLERDEALALARKGADAWNKWAESHRGWSADFKLTDFTDIDFIDINFVGFDFPGKVEFDQSGFGPDIDFADTIFQGSASFVACEFYGPAIFNFAQFMREADFGSSRFHSSADFLRVQFGAGADFTATTFEQVANFGKVRFNGGVEFDDAKFNGNSHFESASFSRSSSFTNTQFYLAADFRAATFHQQVVFWNFADLNADFHGAGLRNSGISQAQVDSSQGDEETQLSDDIARPEHWLNEKPSLVASDDEEKRDAASSEAPPTIPDQIAGISFQISEDGKVSLASSGPASRNELSEIAPIRAVVEAAIEDLLSALKGSNAHGALVSAAELYARALTVDPLSIDQLYAFGMRLENSHARLKRDIESGDIPAMSAVAGEALDTVLGLHGMLIAGTGRGRRLLEDAEKYYQSEATAAELKSKAAEYKIRALEFANVVVNEHELVDELAGEVVVSANEEIGEGSHPGRTSQNARATNQNLLRTMAALSVPFVAAPLIGGAFVESIPGTFAGETLTIAINACWNFFIANRPLLYDFAVVAGKEMAWLIPFLDWIERAYQTRHDGKEK